MHIDAEANVPEGTRPRIPDYDEDLEEEFSGPYLGPELDYEAGLDDEEGENYYEENEDWESSGAREAGPSHSVITNSPEGMPMPQSEYTVEALPFAQLRAVLGKDPEEPAPSEATTAWPEFASSESEQGAGQANEAFTSSRPPGRRNASRSTSGGRWGAWLTGKACEKDRYSCALPSSGSSSGANMDTP